MSDGQQSHNRKAYRRAKRPRLRVKLVTIKSTSKEVDVWDAKARARNLDRSEFLRRLANGAPMPCSSIRQQQGERIGQLAAHLAQTTRSLLHLVATRDTPDELCRLIQQNADTQMEIVLLLKKSAAIGREAKEVTRD